MADIFIGGPLRDLDANCYAIFVGKLLGELEEKKRVLEVKFQRTAGS